jgi:hypothetical protein
VPPVFVLSQMNPVHILLPYLRSVLILTNPSVSWSSELSVTPSRLTKMLRYFLICCVCHMLRSHLVLLNLIAFIIVCACLVKSTNYEACSVWTIIVSHYFPPLTSTYSTITVLKLSRSLFFPCYCQWYETVSELWLPAGLLFVPRWYMAVENHSFG